MSSCAPVKFSFFSFFRKTPRDRGNSPKKRYHGNKENKHKPIQNGGRNQPHRNPNGDILTNYKGLPLPSRTLIPNNHHTGLSKSHSHQSLITHGDYSRIQPPTPRGLPRAHSDQYLHHNGAVPTRADSRQSSRSQGALSHSYESLSNHGNYSEVPMTRSQESLDSGKRNVSRSQESLVQVHRAHSPSPLNRNQVNLSKSRSQESLVSDRYEHQQRSRSPIPRLAKPTFVHSSGNSRGSYHIHHDIERQHKSNHVPQAVQKSPKPILLNGIPPEMGNPPNPPRQGYPPQGSPRVTRFQPVVDVRYYRTNRKNRTPTSPHHSPVTYYRSNYYSQPGDNKSAAQVTHTSYSQQGQGQYSGGHTNGVLSPRLRRYTYNYSPVSQHHQPSVQNHHQSNRHSPGVTHHLPVQTSHHPPTHQIHQYSNHHPIRVNHHLPSNSNHAGHVYPGRRIIDMSSAQNETAPPRGSRYQKNNASNHVPRHIHRSHRQPAQQSMPRGINDNLQCYSDIPDTSMSAPGRRGRPYDSDKSSQTDDDADNDDDGVRVQFWSMTSKSTRIRRLRIIVQPKFDFLRDRTSVKAQSSGAALVVSFMKGEEFDDGICIVQCQAKTIPLPVKVNPHNITAHQSKTGTIVVDAELAKN